MNKMKILILFFLMVQFFACSKDPKPISYGEDECEFCKMMVMDKRYGAEMVTSKGKIFFFDSIECLVGYIDNLKMSKTDYASIWVGNYSNPGSIIDASRAIYLKNDELRSPMGLNVLAVETKEQYDFLFNQFGGKQLTFDDLFELVRAM